MTIVLWICAGMLSAAALLALARIARGPSSLDRVVALDVLLSCLIAGIGLEAAYHRQGLTLPVLAVLALLGFLGAVTVARFGADSDSDDAAEPLVRDEQLRGASPSGDLPGERAPSDEEPGR